MNTVLVKVTVKVKAKEKAKELKQISRSGCLEETVRVLF